MIWVQRFGVYLVSQIICFYLCVIVSMYEFLFRFNCFFQQVMSSSIIIDFISKNSIVIIRNVSCNLGFLNLSNAFKCFLLYYLFSLIYIFLSNTLRRLKIKPIQRFSLLFIYYSGAIIIKPNPKIFFSFFSSITLGRWKSSPSQISLYYFIYYFEAINIKPSQIYLFDFHTLSWGDWNCTD